MRTEHLPAATVKGVKVRLLLFGNLVKGLCKGFQERMTVKNVRVSSWVLFSRTTVMGLMLCGMWLVQLWYWWYIRQRR